MQEQHFNELKTNLSEAIQDAFPMRDASSAVARMEKRVDQLVEENKIMSLPPEEFNLLLDYRSWKGSPDAVGGVFHWKVRK